MSYATLRNALIQMKAAGEDGFEGLAAALLSSLTGERFFVARSGEQPADAISEAGIAIQAKRYDKTTLDETEFEGDFSKACRQCACLDVYVLAATRDTAQLRLLARELEKLHGVDILLVGFAKNESELAALCVSFWSVARRFAPLDALPAAFDTWAAAEGRKPETLTILERLRAELCGRVSRDMVSRLSVQQLTHRFGGEAAVQSRTHNRVDLNRAVSRPTLLRPLENWWINPEAPAIAVLQGEEGTGKTWLAAAFAAQSLQKLDAAPVAFWLDSLSWGQVHTVEALAHTALSGLF